MIAQISAVNINAESGNVMDITVSDGKPQKSRYLSRISFKSRS